MFNNWAGALITAQAAGSALSNSTAATSLLPSGSQFNFPSNYWNVGTKFRVHSSGVISTAASTPGTLTLDFRIGGTVVHSAVSGTLATSASGLGWKWEADITVRSIGAGTAATVVGCSQLFSAALSATTPILIAADAVGTGFNSTASNYLDHFATWSVASASNSITLHQFCIEMLN